MAFRPLTSRALGRPTRALLSSAAVVVAATTACAETRLEPSHPAFEGGETDTWIAYEMHVPGRTPADLLPSFEASARAHGCRTEALGYRSKATVAGGELRHQHGVVADCDEGVIAIVTLVNERGRIGCVRPMTREQCDALLVKISEAR